MTEEKKKPQQSNSSDTKEEPLKWERKTKGIFSESKGES